MKYISIFFKTAWKIFTSFFCFSVYIKDREFSKFDTIKFWATTFCTEAAIGWGAIIYLLIFDLEALLKISGIVVGAMSALTGLAIFSTGLYQWKKANVDKNTDTLRNVSTVPTNTSFIENVKKMAEKVI